MYRPIYKILGIILTIGIILGIIGGLLLDSGLGICGSPGEVPIHCIVSNALIITGLIVMIFSIFFAVLYRAILFSRGEVD